LQHVITQGDEIMAESTGGQQLGIEGQSGSGGGYNPDAQSSQNPGATASNGSGQARETYEKAKQSAAESYTHARQTISNLSGQAQQAASDWSQQTRSQTEAYVREKPWNALGIAAGIGVLIGLLLRR
jgi:ElaB/YqjD/DUF883 family membrane-anchored ribosome-binding protein